MLLWFIKPLNPKVYHSHNEFFDGECLIGAMYCMFWEMTKLQMTKLKLQMCLRSTGEQMATEPPSTDKSVETSESVSASPSQADNQLPPKELRLLKLLLEVASELKTSKLSGISEKQHLRILEETFRGSEPHVLHHYYTKCKEELQVAVFQ